MPTYSERWNAAWRPYYEYATGSEGSSGAREFVRMVDDTQMTPRLRLLAPFQEELARYREVCSRLHEPVSRNRNYGEETGHIHREEQELHARLVAQAPETRTAVEEALRACKEVVGCVEASQNYLRNDTKHLGLVKNIIRIATDLSNELAGHMKQFGVNFGQGLEEIRRNPG